MTLLAPWPHLQAVAASAGLAHGSYDYEAYPQQKLHPDNWRQQA